MPHLPTLDCFDIQGHGDSTDRSRVVVDQSI